MRRARRPHAQSGRSELGAAGSPAAVRDLSANAARGDRPAGRGRGGRADEQGRPLRGGPQPPAATEVHRRAGDRLQLRRRGRGAAARRRRRQRAELQHAVRRPVGLRPSAPLRPWRGRTQRRRPRRALEPLARLLLLAAAIDRVGRDDDGDRRLRADRADDGGDRPRAGHERVGLREQADRRRRVGRGRGPRHAVPRRATSSACTVR